MWTKHLFTLRVDGTFKQWTKICLTSASFAKVRFDSSFRCQIITNQTGERFCTTRYNHELFYNFDEFYTHPRIAWAGALKQLRACLHGGRVTLAVGLP